MAASALARTSWYTFKHPAEKLLPPPWYEFHGAEAYGAAICCAWCRTINVPYRLLHRGELLCSECAALAKAREARAS